MNSTDKTVFTSIRQIGLVTGSLDRFMDNMRGLYRLNPDKTALVPTDSTPETCMRRLAFYDFLGVQLEVVEPLRSHPAWHEFLEKHGDCLQHIQFDVDDLQAAVAQMERNGVALIERGFSISEPEVEYMFYDTVAQTGYVTEIVNFKEIGNRNR